MKMSETRNFEGRVKSAKSDKPGTGFTLIGENPQIFYRVPVSVPLFVQHYVVGSGVLETEVDLCNVTKLDIYNSRKDYTKGRKGPIHQFPF
jgi:hypothetical protein